MNVTVRLEALRQNMMREGNRMATRWADWLDCLGLAVIDWLIRRSSDRKDQRLLRVLVLQPGQRVTSCCV
jgi:hypothetical protein